MSTVTFAIMEGGATRLPQEFKQRRVRLWMQDIRRKLGKNLHGLDYEASIIWGQIMTSAARRRLKLPYHDSLLVATAKRHELTVMTRNVGYFAPFGVETLNPWGDPRENDYDYGEEPEDPTIQPGSTSAEFLIPGDAGDVLAPEGEAAAAA